MPHKDPEVARAYRKANSQKRYETFKRWKTSLTAEELENLKAQARERRKRNPEKFRAQERESKVRHREKVLERKRSYHHRNRERLLKVMRDNAAKNRGRRRAACAEWYRANRDAALASVKRYYQANRDKILAKNRSPLISQQCAYCGDSFLHSYVRRRFCCKRCKHRYNLQVYANNLKAAKRRSRGSFTKREWQEHKAYFNWRCTYCGVRTRKLTIEHVQPLSREGTNDISNIVPACLSCNSRKQKRNLIEFLFLGPLKNKSQNSKQPGV